MLQFGASRRASRARTFEPRPRRGRSAMPRSPSTCSCPHVRFGVFGAKGLRETDVVTLSETVGAPAPPGSRSIATEQVHSYRSISLVVRSSSQCLPNGGWTGTLSSCTGTRRESATPRVERYVSRGCCSPTSRSPPVRRERELPGAEHRGHVHLRSDAWPMVAAQRLLGTPSIRSARCCRAFATSGSSECVEIRMGH